MVQIHVTLKKWGNSFAVRIPSDAVSHAGLALEDSFDLIIPSSEQVLKKWFGALKDSPIDAQAFKDEIRAEEKADMERLDRMTRKRNYDSKPR